MVPVTISGTITNTEWGLDVHSLRFSVRDDTARFQTAGAITLGAGGTFRSRSRCGRRVTARIEMGDDADDQHGAVQIDLRLQRLAVRLSVRADRGGVR
jgi:hypothetical protein